jgi:superfamily I DNA/RNA helicase
VIDLAGAVNTVTTPVMTKRTNLNVDDAPWRRGLGPVLLMAGPGTGKTHQLALRIKNLVEKQAVEPNTITVITFTREAASNMRRRIRNEDNKDVFINPERRPRRITTMHSLGQEVIRAYPEKAGVPEDFVVVTDSILRRVLFRDSSLLCGFEEPEQQAADLARQQCTAVETGTTLAQVITKYEEILRANKAIDYDDQILLACEILEHDDVAREKYAAAAAHLLIDEYQDINPAQRKLISLLSRVHPEGLFVVGDDDQSIYSFRGGTPRFIREFHLDYAGEAGLQMLCLAESRRCPDTVLRAALSDVAGFDAGRVSKPDPTFSATKQNGEPVRIHNVATDDQEAEVVATIAQHTLPQRTILVLIPAKKYAEKIKKKLRRRGISYTPPPNLDDSGFALLDTIYSWIQNPNDNFALRLCLEALCNSGALSIPTKASRKADLIATRRKNLASIASLWQEVIDRRFPSLREALESRAETEGGILAELHESLHALRQIDADDVEKFLSMATKKLCPWTNHATLMKEIRTWLEELRSHGRGSEGTVRVMTLQAAKGLEADVVCVVGLNDGILPRGGATPQDLEEAARLVYVSMTRAKQELHLFHARKRAGSVTYLKESYSLKPSPFLNAIDARDAQLQYHSAPSLKKKVAPTRRSH